MHFEILVEDLSGKTMLEILIPKIIDDREHTFRIIPYKGIGRIPKKLKDADAVGKRFLLNQLPKLIKGYGRTLFSYPASVILVCDLDDRCLKIFRQELLDILNRCEPRPKTQFCVAIEEGEAWLLGDIPAVKSAYPKAKSSKLASYKNDSICGTWEWLADAIFPGGSKALSSKGWQAVGTEKSIWAEKISRKMDVNTNKSSSFRYFMEKLQNLSKLG